MGSDCKVIDWTKPVRFVGTNKRITSHTVMAEGRCCVKWWGEFSQKYCEAIVDSQGHLLWHSDTESMRNKHFVENVLEEKREWLVFHKDERDNWDYLRCGPQPWTNSFADEQIEKFKKHNNRSGGYTDFAKVRYSAAMHSLK